METWKKAAIGAGACALLFAGGFATGKFATPAKVVTKTVVQDRVVERAVVDQVAVAAEVERRVAEEKLKLSQHVVTVTVREKDGTVVTKQTDDTSVQEAESVEDSATAKETSRSHSDTSRTEDETVRQEVTVSNQPRWTVRAMAGIVVTPKAGGIVGLGVQPIYGGGVGYRFLGPLEAGAWGMSSGTVSAGGLSLEVHF